MEKAARELSQHIPPEKRPPPAMFWAHIWALSHGVVELFQRGTCPQARPTLADLDATWPSRTQPHPPLANASG